MAAVIVSSEFAQPPARVWEVIEAIDSHVEWMADAESIRFSGQQRSGLGTRFECVTRVGPVRLVDRMLVTQWQPGVAMGVAHEGLVTGRGTFTLAPCGRGTRFTWSETLRFPWFLGGPVGAALAARIVLTPIWRGNLRRLGEIVGAQASTG